MAHPLLQSRKLNLKDLPVRAPPGERLEDFTNGDDGQALRAGMRVVRVGGPKSRGRARWLMSALMRHITKELLRPDLDGAEEDET